MRRNTTKLALLIGVTAALIIQTQRPVQAHGAKIETLPQSVEIVATFDTGEPMANAQVSVYAPDALEAPWQSGQTDGEGRFLFAPDGDAPAGQWEVTVRKAGHGQTTTFALGTTEKIAADDLGISASQNSAAQKWFGVAAIVWGCVGTSLYFLRKGDGESSRVSLAEGEPQRAVEAQSDRTPHAAANVASREYR